MAATNFCLKWTKFESNILNAFESLQTTQDLADVTLACEGLSIKAHRFILSACSPYFRALFKTNPCSHPIVILKDVKYVDLIAIVNFMYHGEVTVSEDQFPSFLQTAFVLQVSGLVNNDGPCSVNKHTEVTKKTKVPHEVDRSNDSLPKKLQKTNPVKTCKPISSELRPESKFERKLEENLFPAQEKNPEKVKLEKVDSPEGSSCDNRVSPPSLAENKHEGSILEAALEVNKQGSILERSLTLPSKPSFSCEKPNPLQMLREISMTKTIFGIHRSEENDKSNFRTSSESSSSPSTYDRASEFLHPLVKIEDTSCEMEVERDIPSSEESAMDFSRTLGNIEVPHHSSQCGTCPHCGKIYSNQSALKYHVRLVHSDLTNMYCCHLCPESFDYREGYKKHMADVHSIRN